MNESSAASPEPSLDSDATIEQLRARVLELQQTLASLRSDLEAAQTALQDDSGRRARELHGSPLSGPETVQPFVPYVEAPAPPSAQPAPQPPAPKLREPPVHRPAGQFKVLDLPGGLQLFASPQGAPLLFAGERYVGWKLSMEQGTALLAVVQSWLNTPAAFLASRKNDRNWKAAAEAERQLKALLSSTETALYQIAFESRMIPGAIWLQPEEGLPYQDALAVLEEQQRLRPDTRVWLEPLQRVGQLLRITTAQGAVTIINEIRYPHEGAQDGS